MNAAKPHLANCIGTSGETPVEIEGGTPVHKSNGLGRQGSEIQPLRISTRPLAAWRALHEKSNGSVDRPASAAPTSFHCGNTTKEAGGKIMTTKHIRSPIQ